MRVVSPYAIGGHGMARAILRPAVLDFVDLTTHPATSRSNSALA